MNEEPDFIENFKLEGDVEQQKIREKYAEVTIEEYLESSISGEGIFEMYIENKEKVGSLEKISGKVHNNYGDAVFNGELGKHFIKFTKKYYNRLNGAVDYEIPYEATLNLDNGIFSGKYKMEGETESWEGMFELIPTELVLKGLFGNTLN